jgi:hypothetical protein
VDCFHEVIFLHVIEGWLIGAKLLLVGLWGCGTLSAMGSSEQINKILRMQGASRGFGKSGRRMTYILATGV